MHKAKLFTGVVIIGLLAVLVGACVPQPGPTPSPVPTPAPTPSPMPTPTPAPALSGTLKVYVTDAPPREQVTSIMVTVSEVQIHKAPAEQEREQEQQQSVGENQTQEQEREREQQQTQQGEGEWITIDLSDNATTFDLLKIKGVEQSLGASEVTAGKYTQVRLVVDKIQVALDGGELQDAEVPGKELKLVHPFNIIAGEATAMVIDFDADKMVTVTGAGKIIVKPVVKLLTKQMSKGKPEGTEKEKTEALKFEGIIETIDGSIWTMTVDGKSKTVDVSSAKVEGEPAVGLKAEVKGTVTEDKIIASNVEVEERETPQGEAEEQGTLEVSCDDFMKNKNITQEVEVNVGGSFKVTLCSNPTTGFQWSEAAHISDQTVLQQMNHEFFSPEAKGMVGAAGKDVWTFEAIKEGTSTISMEYSRPWQGGEKGEWTFELTVVVK